jgi:Flp pilus assembly protein TadD
VLRDAVAGVGVSAELADLLFEMEQWEEAARAYASVWADPWADYRLGIVYERLGEPVSARASYLRALAAWEGADAEWQPFVREIRTALARLQHELG